MTIRNNKDLELAYFYLKMLDSNADYTKELKRDIRAYTHRPERISRVFDADYDGYIAVYPLPERIASKEEAIDFFEDNERRSYRPSYYDCTGQAFTAWYKVFQKNGRFWVYHRISYDV